MKIVYTRIVVSLFTIGLASQILMAQNGFDAKKRKNAIVDASSLGTIHIKGSNGNKIGSGIRSNVAVSKGQAFPSSLLQQGEKIIYSRETGLPSFITSTRRNSNSRMGTMKDVDAAAHEYLAELKPLLQLERNTDTDFAIRSTKRDKVNKAHVRLDQNYRGIPVYGAEVIVHLNEFGEGESFNGTYYLINENIDPVPAISELAAVEKVISYRSNGTPIRPLSIFEKKLVQHEKPEATLCIYRDKGLRTTSVLAYHVVYCPTLMERWEYFVDASTGSVLHQFESTCLIDGPRTATGPDLNGISRTVNTYELGTAFFMVDVSRPMYDAGKSTLPDEPVGGILTIDMDNTFGDDQTFQHATSSNNSWNTSTQTKALSAHFNAGVAYEYFRTKHSRNSIDGEGGTIISIINVPDEDGEALDNAFWNGKAMFYGDGNVGFKPLAGAIDVAGHEMTHGVVQSTANLEYQGESGAINESIADIFGSMMDPADWLIGEDVVKPASFPSGALRSLEDPHNGGTNLGHPGYQPKHMDEAYTGTEDNGGVHINSGIPNHAFYLYAEAVTRDKASAVFYKALDDYLTKSSQFVDFRLAVIKAAGDLFGTSSNEVTQAGIAFDAVGITTGQPGEYTETLPANPGSEFLLLYNTDTSSPNTLYRAPLNLASGTPLTTTQFRTRPSVTDNGDLAVFVAEDNTIHVIRTAPGTEPSETIFDDRPIWSNVVISKGGTKLAAVTIGLLPTIYVYDFESGETGEFELYNPTYTEGVSSAGPQYADALEWDYTGQYLVYDCFNSLDNALGDDIEYWDVNFIHVWDNDANNFADGTIEKLFSSLPPGVSIGNPAFAKNSPYILAFDYVDESEDDYLILGCNIETNEVEIIAENNTFGWPSYNKSDSRIAFTALDGTASYEARSVALNSDKISSSVSSQLLVSSFKWPVYFATGSREFGEDVITDVLDEVNGNASINCYPNPFTHEVSIELKEPTTADSRIEVINSIGQKVYESKLAFTSGEPVQVILDNLKNGYYIIRVLNSKKVESCKIMKR